MTTSVNLVRALAKEQGGIDHDAGKSVADNPYDKRSEEHEAWTVGWNDANEPVAA